MKRFSVWLDCEDQEKLEKMAKAQGLKTGYFIRRAVKEYVVKHYPAVMLSKKILAEVDAKEKKKIQEEKTKAIKITPQQKQSLKVGLRARTQVRERKEKERRGGFPR